LNTELRRRAYLDAMQVVSWLPRVELPFAAPSRPERLRHLEPPRPLAEPPVARVQASAVSRVLPPREPAQAQAIAQAAPPVADQPPRRGRERPRAVPRFALQLLRAGACALLVELPTGEALQRRDPAYLLLKDLLRAAGLPDSPQLVGEPVRWPLLSRGSLDQGPQAALDFVRSFVAARLEEQEPCACLWLVGLPAIRFTAAADAERYHDAFRLEGLGACWALPGLELLLEQPERKRELWRAMQRVRGHWAAESP
jgi:hypothetical protein